MTQRICEKTSINAAAVDLVRERRMLSAAAFHLGLHDITLNELRLNTHP
jgi:hypothetical protein